MAWTEQRVVNDCAVELTWGQNVPATDWNRMFQLRADGEARSGYLFKSDVPYFVMREQVSMSLGISERQYVKISDKRSPE